MNQRFYKNDKRKYGCVKGLEAIARRQDSDSKND